MGGKIEVPALRPEIGQIGQGRLAAGQDDQIRISREGTTWGHEVQSDTRLRDQWVEIVEVGDPRQHWHHDFDLRTRWADRGRIQRDRVFGGQAASFRKKGDDPKRRKAAVLTDRLHSF